MLKRDQGKSVSMAVREIVCHGSDEITKFMKKPEIAFCACTFIL